MIVTCLKEATPTQKTLQKFFIAIGKTVLGNQWSNGAVLKWLKAVGSTLGPSTQSTHSGRKKGFVSIVRRTRKKGGKHTSVTAPPSAEESLIEKGTERTQKSFAYTTFSNATKGSEMLHPFSHTTKRLFWRYTNFARNLTMRLFPLEPRSLFKWTTFGPCVTKNSVGSMFHGIFKY